MPGRDADMAASLAQQGPITVRAACAVSANTCKSSVRMPCASSDAVNAARPALMNANTETQGDPAGSGRATRQHNSTGLLSSLTRLYFFILHETIITESVIALRDAFWYCLCWLGHLPGCCQGVCSQISAWHAPPYFQEDSPSHDP